MSLTGRWLWSLRLGLAASGPLWLDAAVIADWLPLALALGLSFAYSGLEGAVLAVSRVRVVHAAREGGARARRLLVLLEDRDALLACMTVINHALNGLCFALLLRLLPLPLGPWALLGLLLGSLPFLLVLEVLPKKLFRRFPFRLLRALWPLVALGGWLRPLFSHLGRMDAAAREESMAAGQGLDGAADLRAAALGLAQRHQLSSAAAELLGRALEFAPMKVAEVMKPLDRAFALGADLGLDAAAMLMRRAGEAALPVMDASGAFCGLLELGQIPTSVPGDRLVRQHMRSLDRVRVSDQASAALRLLRRRARPMGLVLDEHGEPCGLLRHDDLLQHLLVGGSRRPE